MSTGKKVIIGVVAVVLLGGAVAGNVWMKRTPGKAVTLEKVQTRDLEAIVSASGKIQARTTVNISADTMGRVTELAVDEGQTVKKGQFLMQIDPRNQLTAADRTAAGLAAARSQLEQLRNTVAAARENLALSRENLRRQRELWAQQLTTRQALDQAESEVKVREANLRDSEQSLGTQEQRIRESAATVSSARVRAVAGPYRVADRRPDRPPQHRAGRDGGHRHDEQRRHRAAADRRHVDHRGRSRGRRDRHPVRADRPARPRSRSTPSRTRPSPAR